MGYIGIVQHKEHPPELFHIPPGTPCIYNTEISLGYKRITAVGPPLVRDDHLEKFQEIKVWWVIYICRYPRYKGKRT